MFRFKRRLLVVAVLAFCTSPAFSQDPSPARHLFTLSEKNSSTAYDPSVPRLGLQLGSAVLLGTAGGAVGALGGALLAPQREGLSGLIVLPYAATGAYLGYSMSSALGIYIVANSKFFNASFGKILLGHAIGATAGLGSIYLMDAIEGPEGPAIIFALAAPIVGGMIANYKSITRRNNGNTSAFLNIEKGNAELASPSLKLDEVGNFNLVNNKRAAMIKLLNISL